MEGADSPNPCIVQGSAVYVEHIYMSEDSWLQVAETQTNLKGGDLMIHTTTVREHLALSTYDC